MKLYFCRKLTRRKLGVVFHPHDGNLEAFGIFVYQNIIKAQIIESSRNTEKLRPHVIRLTRSLVYKCVQKLCTKKGRGSECRLDNFIQRTAPYQLRASFNNEIESSQKVNEKKFCALSCFTSVTASLRHLPTSSTRHSAMGFCWAFNIPANW